MEKIKKQQAKTIESWNRTAKAFNDTIASLDNYDHTYQFVCDRLHDGDAVLDLACGPGQDQQVPSEKKKSENFWCGSFRRDGEHRQTGNPGRCFFIGILS